MRFLLDESADFRLGRYLSSQGHDVTAISRDYPQSLVDEAVLEIAYREQRILITRDRDFGELIFLDEQRHSGVILFRLGPRDYDIAIHWLDEIIANHQQDLADFLVVTHRGVRVRGSTLH